MNKSQLPRSKPGSWDSCFQLSVGQRIGPHLELDELGCGSFAAFHVEGRPRGDRRVNALPFPAAVGIIDAAVQSLSRSSPSGKALAALVNLLLSSTSKPSERLPVATGVSLPAPSVSKTFRRSCNKPNRRCRFPPLPYSSDPGTDRASSLRGTADRSRSARSAGPCTCADRSWRDGRSRAPSRRRPLPVYIQAARRVAPCTEAFGLFHGTS